MKEKQGAHNTLFLIVLDWFYIVLINMYKISEATDN